MKWVDMTRYVLLSVIILIGFFVADTVNPKERWALKRNMVGLEMIVAHFDGDIQLPNRTLEQSQKELCDDAAKIFSQAYKQASFYCMKVKSSWL
jgi:hypothetical protein